MVKQDTAEWLQLRKKYIGASDAAIIMGKCKFKLPDGRIKTPRILWEEKLGLMNMSCDNAATQYGKRMEDPARKVYEKMTGIPVAPDVVFHKDVKYLMASLDGVSIDADFAVEIKNSNAHDHECAKNGRVPDHYFPQVQQQLACLDLDRMHYFSFHKGEGIIVDVKIDLDYLELYYERAQEFWDYVENLEEPPLVDADFREEGREWELKASRLWEIEESIKRDIKLSKDLKDELKSLSEGFNARAGIFRLVGSARKGSVDYERIPELKGVDLECFRKPPTHAWSLRRDRT